MPRDGADYLTSLPINRPDRPLQGSRTVVCFGAPRGGTSMVGGAVLGLGVPMGQGLKNNLEDPDFDVVAHGGKLEDFIQGARETIKSRNAAHEIWGWKCPFAARYLPDIIQDLRAPMLVCIYRDPVPIALRAKVPGEEAVDFLKGRMRAQIRNTEVIEKLGVPSLFVSFERVTSHPDVFLDELAAFLGLDVPNHRDEIVQFLAPGRYKDPSGLMARLTPAGEAGG